MAKLDAGVVVPSPETFTLCEVTRGLVAEYSLQAASKGLTLRMCHAECIRRSRVHTDRTLLERILRNLIENAIRYTETGGVTVVCRSTDGAVRIEVRDTGIGIPPGERDAIFEEFYQVDGASSERRQGLGLGLSIVRRLCGLLGATITLSSVPGQGTCLAVAVPAAAPAGAPPARHRRSAEPPDPLQPPPPTAAPREEGSTVLLVDDDAELLQSVREDLEDWGLRVVAAGSGEEAVAAVGNGLRPDAVVADFRMGRGLNGVDTVARVRALCGRPVPAAVMTGDTAPERLRAVTASGCAILHKPVGSDELRAALARLLAAEPEPAA